MIPTNKQLNTFIGPEEPLGLLAGWINHIDRFSRLNALFSQDTPKERYDRVCTACFSIQEHMREKGQDISKLAGKLKALHPDILSLFKVEKLKETIFLETVHKDFKAMMYSSCQISDLGWNGPTLLIDYIRANSSSPETWTRNGVIKWTKEEEFHSMKVFHELFDLLEDPQLKVPSSYFIDLDSSTFSSFEKTCISIDPQMVDCLKQSIRYIALHNDCHPNKVHQFMVATKVQGSNLRDCILHTYRGLSAEQKSSLFEGLGKISFIDTVVGNLDRFMQVDANFTGFVIGSQAPANLGNVMVAVPKNPSDPVTVYGIDHEIHSKEDDLAKYQHFVCEFSKKRFKESILARNISNSIEASFRKTGSRFYCDLTEIIDLNGTDETLGEVGPIASKEMDAYNVAAFLQDLGDFGKKTIEKGVHIMEEKILSLAPSTLEESTRASQIVQERIKTFITKGI